MTRFNKFNKPQLGEIVRFGIVGVLATVLQYAVYWLMAHCLVPTIANMVGYVVSLTFNYFASVRFTFRVKSNAKKGIGFFLSHCINFLLQTLFLNLFLALGVSKNWAPFPMFAVCVPINFLLVRYFLKK